MLDMPQKKLEENMPKILPKKSCVFDATDSQSHLWFYCKVIQSLVQDGPSMSRKKQFYSPKSYNTLWGQPFILFKVNFFHSDSSKVGVINAF